MSKWISIAVLAAGLSLAGPALASDAGYLYGRVLTVDGDTYQGELRWGDEEAFWGDMFNATKIGNDYLGEVDDDVLDRMRRHHREVWDVLFHNRDNNEFTHIFAIRFGDLKRIDVRRGDRVTVTFRNGEEMDLDGGSNDVGARITVLNPGHGTYRIDWRRIRTIDFLETPAKLAEKLGDPIWGTVKTRRFEFTGPIQWDNDECLSIDALDGETRDGKVSIPFGDIASIRKHRSGSLVTLTSGSELYVTGTNDVNSENRGIVVKLPDIGSVKVGWGDFVEATFRHPAPGSGRGYADFGKGRRLAGVVDARGGRLSGDIVYDLDEAWDFELLQGRDHDTEYLIPFREIARIEPHGYRADVVLRNGQTISLEDSQDVSRDNDGLLVATHRGRPEYVDWRDVDAIRFR